MKKNNLNKYISIKWKIFLYFVTFLAILLIGLWIVQTVYLDSIYKKIKKTNMKKTVSVIEEHINGTDILDDDMYNYLEDKAKEIDANIAIIDEDGYGLYFTNTSNMIKHENMSSEKLKKLISDNKDIDKIEEIDIIKYEDLYQTLPEENAFENKDKYKPDRKPDAEDNNKYPNYNQTVIDNQNKKMNTFSMFKVIKDSNGDSYGIIISSNVIPVDATVHTIRVELFYISIIMIFISLILALLLSRRFSNPIINLNKSAKEFAKGNFDIKFDANGFKEITELSDTLKKTAIELKKADALKKDLIANVSHDLRTPLTMITAYSEIMRDIPGENTPENVQVIIDETNRLTKLVNDLLDLSKIQAGVTSLETKEYDLTESIESVILRHSKLLEPYDYKINFEFDCHVLVDADEFKIYQVIYNLIANAINYTGEDKKVTIKQIVNDDTVRIEVVDTGKGISEDEIENVWERYYKIDKTHKRAIIGTGLGLSIVKNILDLHGAKYGVDSTLGKGSSFWFEMKVTEKI